MRVVSVELPSTTLILARHAQARSRDGSYDRHTPLSDLGLRQAAALAMHLLEPPRPAVVYSSPWTRAAETAAPLCERLDVAPVIDDRLVEFELPGQTLESASRPDLVVWQGDHRGVEDGESLREFSLRVAHFFEEIVGPHLGERVVVVSHSGTMDAAVRWAMGVPPSSPWQHDLLCPNACITELDLWPQGRVPGGSPRYAAIRRVGDVGHLGDLASEM